MADDQVSRPKRKGNYYIPPHIKAIQAEVAEKYAALISARQIAKTYGISKTAVLNIIERNGQV